MKLYFETLKNKDVVNDNDALSLYEGYYKDRDDEFEYYLEQNDIEFDYNRSGEYIFQSAVDARDALRLAKALGYTSSWRETNKVYLVDKGN